MRLHPRPRAASQSALLSALGPVLDTLEAWGFDTTWVRMRAIGIPTDMLLSCLRSADCQAGLRTGAKFIRMQLQESTDRVRSIRDPQSASMSPWNSAAERPCRETARLAALVNR